MRAPEVLKTGYKNKKEKDKKDLKLYSVAQRN